MKRILVANDLGPGGANALARAIRLAAADGAAIRVIHAATDPRPGSAHRIETEARIMAEELCARPPDISATVAASGAAEAILAEAQAWEADLIVLGGHGEPRFRDALFGTTGTHVVRHAGRPVLIVQDDAAEAYAKALVAIGEVRTAPGIFAAALDLAPASEIFAVHAFDPTLGETLHGPAALDRLADGRMLELEKTLGATGAARHPAKASPGGHVIVETGEPLEVVMRASERLAPDLIVMGTRNRATYLGSHAVDTVFWSPCDLLVVPEAEAAEPVEA